MPSSYSLYQMTLFPEIGVGETISGSIQTVMDLAAYGIDDPPKTEFTLQRHIDDLDINVYRVFHETIVKRTGRAKGVTFSAFIENKLFPAYYHKGNKLLMVKTGKDTAQGAIRALKKVGLVDGERRDISLSSIKSLVEHFKGAWFSVDGSVDVSSQALFGPSVDRDLRFERASAEGEMYYIRLDYLFGSELIHIGVSDDSNIVIFDNNLDEHLELELVLDVKAKLLDPALDK